MYVRARMPHLECRIRVIQAAMCWFFGEFAVEYDLHRCLASGYAGSADFPQSSAARVTL
jgi:hypothetical protein